MQNKMITTLLNNFYVGAKIKYDSTIFCADINLIKINYFQNLSVASFLLIYALAVKSSLVFISL